MIITSETMEARAAALCRWTQMHRDTQDLIDGHGNAMQLGAQMREARYRFEKAQALERRDFDQSISAVVGALVLEAFEAAKFAATAAAELTAAQNDGSARLPLDVA